MRTASLIVAGVLAAAAVVAWKLSDPAPRSCRALRVSTAEAVGGRVAAHVERRTCDAGLRSGLFVVVEKSSRPGTRYEAFYSPRDLRAPAVRWTGDRSLEISFSEPLDAVERKYDGQSIAGMVAVTVKSIGVPR
jgi:hypothetical protein